MKFAVLSNINMDSLENHLKFPDLERFYSCGYNQHIQDLINPSSELHKTRFDFIFIHIEGEELLKDDYFSSEKESTFDNFTQLLDSIKKYSDTYPEVTIIISEIIFPPFTHTSFITDDNGTKSLNNLENKTNRELYQFSKDRNNVLILEFGRLIKKYGYERLIDDKYWYLARIKYSFDGFQSLAGEIQNLIMAYLGKTKKVLILDLDNTLWGGIVGEDGQDGLQLSEEGIGKCYRDFQKAVKSVMQVGVLLAVCSKNNLSDVDVVFHEHPMMILKESDFIVRKINWQNKVQNIIEIGNELGLGLDSFVFIDDNPVERDLVAENLPQVSVPDFPKDISNLKKWFLSEVVYQYFPKHHLTKEDKDKTRQYSRNIKRTKLQKSLNLDDFIKSLDITLSIYDNPENLVPRLAQLTQKTNQFNLTTRRYVEKDIRIFITSKDHQVHALSYQDKFGDEGIIGEIIYRLNKPVGVIDIFLLSCRIIGRNVEYSFLQNSLRKLQELGITKIQAEYLPTQKNVPVNNLYGDIGFHAESENRFTGQTDELIQKLSKRLSLNTQWTI